MRSCFKREAQMYDGKILWSSTFTVEFDAPLLVD